MYYNYIVTKLECDKMNLKEPETAPGHSKIYNTYRGEAGKQQSPETT